MLPLLIFHSIIVGLFIALGILFSCGKGAFLVAGYNTSSKEEKSHTDEKLLLRFMGKLMFLLAGCWLVIALASGFHIISLHIIGIVLVVIAIAGAVVYANTGNRFKK
ncbi:MAG: DUF3784 domain-containing protein [Ruminococcus flavefaciens]|nr:DUF3784 domain-containing protein [Ruminococcus flavefaciens]